MASRGQLWYLRGMDPQQQGFVTPPGQSPEGWSHDPQTVEQGKAWAFLSYASFFVGFPVWIIPLAQRDNAYSLYHAKQAGASYIMGFAAACVIGIIAVVTCGIGAVLFPLALFPLVTAVHGLMLVNGGEAREPILVFGIGDKLFKSIQPKPPQG
jgi:hypothetical protein